MPDRSLPLLLASMLLLACPWPGVPMTTDADPGTGTSSPGTTNDSDTTTPTTGEPVVPGAARLVYRAGGALFVVDVDDDGHDEAHELAHGAGVGWGPHFSPSRKWALYGMCGEGRLCAADLSGPLPAPVARLGVIPYGWSEDSPAPQFPPDESWLVAVNSNDHDVHCRLDGSDRDCVEIAMHPPPNRQSGVVVSPDGTRIAFLDDPDGNDIGQIFVFAVGPDGLGEQIYRTSEPSSGRHAMFLPDGGLLYHYGFNDGVQQLKGVDLDAPAPAAVKLLDYEEPQFRADRSAAVWRRPMSSELRFGLLFPDSVAVGPDVLDGVTSARWSTDGRFLVGLVLKEPDYLLDIRVVDTAQSWADLAAVPVHTAAPGFTITALTVLAERGRMVYALQGLGTDVGVSSVWLAPTDGASPPVILGESDVGLQYVTAADDSSILLMEYGVGLDIVDTFDAPEPRTLVPTPVQLAATSSDGARVFYVTAAGELRRIEVDGSGDAAIAAGVDRLWVLPAV